MKRLMTLLLTLCLVLTLSACIAIPVTPVSTPTTEAPTALSTEPATVPTEAPATEAPTTEVPTTEAPATEAPTTEAPDTEAPTEAPEDRSIRGVVEENVYTNEYLGLRVALPEDWIFYTEEQIAMIYQLSVEMWEDADAAELIASNGQIMDMGAMCADGSSVNLILQENPAALDGFTDLLIFQLSEEVITTQMKAGGMEVVYYDPMTAQISGEDHAVLHMVVKKDDVEIEEYQLWFRSGSDYMGILTFTLMGEEDLQDILNGVTTLN